MNTRQKIFFISLALAIATLTAYAWVYQFEFISFDDNLYVTENQQVQQGISPENLQWAFSPSKGADQTYWHPLTWLSHMLDCQLFGLNPGAHHLMNLLFHILNVTLLFLALLLMTGEIWKCAFVAALFALHPINADSVAWIAERKNLLSTLFWMLTLLAYIHYTRKPSISRYLMVFFALALGLLAKPMLVTLPCVLLILDFWPLGRMDIGQKPVRQISGTGTVFQPAGISRLILEKLPLLCLSLLSIGISFFTLQANKQMSGSVLPPPILLRVENALVSYWMYLWKLIYPAKLAFFYPFPKTIPLWQPTISALFLLAFTIYLIIRRCKSPYLCAGWFWFLGTLLPVIGLIHGGLWPALADRWAYVPAIGVFIMAAWGIPEIFRPGGAKKNRVWIPAAAVLCTFGVLTHKQAGHWLNNETLYTHALIVTSGNYIAHNNLGNAIKLQGRTGEAINHYAKAIEIKPDYADSYYNMANAFKDLAQADRAVRYYRKAIDIQPDHEKAHNNLGSVLLGQGCIEEAIWHYLQAIQIKPDYESALYNLGIAYFNIGNMPCAVAAFKEALQLNPSANHIRAALEQATGKK